MLNSERVTGLDRLIALVQEVAAKPESSVVLYVAHPLRPTDEEVAIFAASSVWRVELDASVARTTRENLRRAKRWLAWLRVRHPAITFIEPWITAIESGADDRDPEQRARGLRDDAQVVRRCDGIVLCGGRVSSGMQHEAQHAANVIDLTALGPEPPR